MPKAEPAPAGAPRAVAVYNRYLHRGGEDEVFEADLRLLQRHGWSVVPVVARTRVPRGPIARLRFGVDAIWSRAWRHRFDALLRLVRPHVVHVVNLFPSLSPAIYGVCRRHRVPVVQVVQNYRLGCPKATFFRDGAICELCKGRAFAWPGVRHRCYHGSALQSATVGAVTAVHRLLGTWQRDVALYLAASAPSAAKLVECGLPAEKVAVRANFLDPDPGAKEGVGDFALFVGRLSAEKGVPTLLAAIASTSAARFKLVGDGALLGEAQDLAARLGDGRLEVLGRRSHREVIALMRRARLLVFPSEWYEGQPMTLVEAFACGLPVVASAVGAAEFAVQDGVSGVHVPPGDPAALASAVERLWPDRSRLRALGQGARRSYVRLHTAESSYSRLMQLYRRAGVALGPPSAPAGAGGKTIHPDSRRLPMTP